MLDNQESKELDEALDNLVDLSHCVLDIIEAKDNLILNLEEQLTATQHRLERIIAGVKKAMEVLEDAAPTTIWMDNFNEIMWEHLASIIDFEAEKQQELPLEDTTLQKLTTTQQALDAANEKILSLESEINELWSK